MAEEALTETARVEPFEVFRETIRPARLLLDLHRLLDSGDSVQTTGEFVERVRAFVSASATEDLVVVQNAVFLGLVREKAGIPSSHFKTAMLGHLLRQAIVASATALDTFLPAIVRQKLPEVIRY